MNLNNEFQKLITQLQIEEGLSEMGVLLLEGFAVRMEKAKDADMINCSKQKLIGELKEALTVYQKRIKAGNELQDKIFNLICNFTSNIEKVKIEYYNT